MSEPVETVEVQKLPLWKNAVEAMRASGIAYGQSWPAEFFEQHLKLPRDAMTFGISMSHIRRALESDGFYLSGRGQRGRCYVVLPASDNVSVMAAYKRLATDALKRSVILGTNTDVSVLSVKDRESHERMCRNMATKLVLVQRSGQVASVLNKSEPKLLSGT